MQFKITKIPKGRRTFRTIYCVDDETKKTLSSYLSLLHELMDKLDESGVSYGFVRRKNCALMASKHIGFVYTLSFDLVDFFEHVKVHHVRDIIPEEIIIDCFVNGAPQQGLPTSPLIANIAFGRYDREIVRQAKKIDPNIVYTRYADDLVFSFDDFASGDKIKSVVSSILDNSGFKISERKTKIQSSKNGRRVITGISVGENDLRATRKTKKKLRAATHQCNIRSARGLFEWSLCKLPNELEN